MTQGVRLPDSLQATDNMERLLQHTDIFLMVVPTPFVAATMSSIKDKLRPEQVPLLLVLPRRRNHLKVVWQLYFLSVLTFRE